MARKNTVEQIIMMLLGVGYWNHAHGPYKADWRNSMYLNWDEICQWNHYMYSTILELSSGEIWAKNIFHRLTLPVKYFFAPEPLLEAY